MNIIGNIITKVRGMALKTKIIAGFVIVAVIGGAVSGGVIYHNYKIEESKNFADVELQNKAVRELENDVKRILKNSEREKKYKNEKLSELNEYVEESDVAYREKKKLSNAEMEKIHKFHHQIKKDLDNDILEYANARQKILDTYWKSMLSENKDYFDKATVDFVHKISNEFSKRRLECLNENTSITVLDELNKKLDAKLKEYIIAKEGEDKVKELELAKSDNSNKNNDKVDSKSTADEKNKTIDKKGGTTSKSASSQGNIDEKWEGFNTTEKSYKEMLELFKKEREASAYTRDPNDPYESLWVSDCHGNYQIVPYGSLPKDMHSYSYQVGWSGYIWGKDNVKNETDYQRYIQNEVKNMYGGFNSVAEYNQWAAAPENADYKAKRIPETLEEALNVGYFRREDVGVGQHLYLYFPN